MDNEPLDPHYGAVFAVPENGTPDNITPAGCLALARLGKEAWNAWRLKYPAYVDEFAPIFSKNCAVFSNHTFTEEISFEGFVFDHGARFERAIFLNPVQFEGAEFGNDASFCDAKFHSRGNFNDAKFLAIMLIFIMQYLVV